MPGMQFTLMEGGICWTAPGEVAQLVIHAASSPFSMVPFIILTPRARSTWGTKRANVCSKGAVSGFSFSLVFSGFGGRSSCLWFSLFVICIFNL